MSPPPFDPTTFWREDDVVGMMRQSLLEEMVHDAASQLASNAINSNEMEQFLRGVAGWSVEDIEAGLRARGFDGTAKVPSNGKCLHPFVEPPAPWDDFCWEMNEDEDERCGWTREEHES